MFIFSQFICMALYCAFLRTVQEPGVQKPALMFASCYSTFLLQDRQMHCLCWCVRMALPRGSVACPQQCLLMLFYCLDHQNKTASGELPIDIEVWPQTNLELCPRAVSDGACWLTPNSCQESVSMSGGIDYYIVGPRNIPKNARYYPY